jgi:O-antigen/teichoic acid export membrane protein
MPATTPQTIRVPQRDPIDVVLEEELEALAEPLPETRGWRSRVRPKFVYALLDQGVVSFGNMVVSAAVARNCAAGDFGVFILALRSLDVINQICNVMIWGPYAFNVHGITEDRQKGYLGSLLMHQAIASAVGALLFLIFGAIAASVGNTEYTGLFLPLVLPSLAIVFREFTRRVYFSHFRFREALILDTITVTLQVAGIVVLIHRHALSMQSALWALALSSGGVCVYWLATERRHLSFDWRECFNDFHFNMQLGKWFLGSNGLFLASQQISPWLLSATSGTASVAAFAVCDQVVNIPRVALTSMQNMMPPTMSKGFAEGGKDRLRSVVRRMDVLIISGCAFFAACIVFFGPWVSRAIYHKTPANAKTILVLLALNLLVYGGSLAQSYALSAINRADLNFYVGVWGIVVQVALAFALVKSYGVPGVAFALLVANTVVLVVRVYYYLREMRRL